MPVSLSVGLLFSRSDGGSVGRLNCLKFSLFTSLAAKVAE